jgi:hypothetical protein
MRGADADQATVTRFCNRGTPLRTPASSHNSYGVVAKKSVLGRSAPSLNRSGSSSLNATKAEIGKFVPQNVNEPSSPSGLFVDSLQPCKIGDTTGIQRSELALLRHQVPLWKALLSRWPTNRCKYRLEETNSRDPVPSPAVIDRSRTLEFKSTELLKNCLQNGVP